MVGESKEFRRDPAHLFNVSRKLQFSFADVRVEGAGVKLTQFLGEKLLPHGTWHATSATRFALMRAEKSPAIDKIVVAYDNDDEKRTR